MELTTLPASKASYLVALNASGLVRTKRSAAAAAAPTPPCGAGLATVPLAGAVRSEWWCACDALAPVGASTAIAAARATEAPPMTILLTRESPCEGLDRATDGSAWVQAGLSRVTDPRERSVEESPPAELLRSMGGLCEKMHCEHVQKSP